jgi:CRISPR-associated protein Csm2
MNNNGSYDGRSKYNARPQNRNDRNADHSSNYTHRPYQPGEPKEVPEDFVTAAENLMRGKGKSNLTTTKLRNILSMASDIYNVENNRKEEHLAEENKTALRKMHVRIVYEAGRDRDVRNFVVQSHLINYIKYIEGSWSRKLFIRFENYLEALVAFHRFFGGK